ncbi:hypothetical protein E2562_019237 [Oryza meyeriana var. granulata]|uniref:Uncharacterized protein n=1 Tax=Oryza meyeriana var. granulata TaxID=110450 RepID=A0A6G1FA92_9ORYZ|nr:hypothetical protein E2562_019237 [Oryza meyeriana var. granulata]
MRRAGHRPPPSPGRPCSTLPSHLAMAVAQTLPSAGLCRSPTSLRSPPGFRQAAPSSTTPRRVACTSPLYSRPGHADAASSSPHTAAPAPFVHRSTRCYDARASLRPTQGRGQSVR